jgi:hypothetical protein
MGRRSESGGGGVVLVLVLIVLLLLLVPVLAPVPVPFILDELDGMLYNPMRYGASSWARFHIK